MINIKLHKNEIELIKEGIESSKFLGHEPKLCDRVLKKLDKALTIPDVVGQSEQLVSFLRQYQKTCEIMHVNKINAKDFVGHYKTN
jgi:hypothetical protein